MAKELGWSNTRKNEEFKIATSFLRSMGLSEARVGKLTLDDVRQGRHKVHLAIDDDVLGRAVFTAPELAELKIKFKEMDLDEDGKISVKDLSATMSKLGFVDVPMVSLLTHSTFSFNYSQFTDVLSNF